jgi:hypothetical protein
MHRDYRMRTCASLVEEGRSEPCFALLVCLLQNLQTLEVICPTIENQYRVTCLLAVLKRAAMLQDNSRFVPAALMSLQEVTVRDWERWACPWDCKSATIFTTESVTRPTMLSLHCYSIDNAHLEDMNLSPKCRRLLEVYRADEYLGRIPS